MCGFFLCSVSIFAASFFPDRVAAIRLYARRIFRYLSANSRVILVRVPLR